MAIRIVRLGSPRAKNEGVRVGTVRRPPRGVPKAEYTARDLYDVWFPELAPNETLLREGLVAVDAAAWRRFVRRYRGGDEDAAGPSLARLARGSVTSDEPVGRLLLRASGALSPVRPAVRQTARHDRPVGAAGQTDGVTQDLARPGPES